MEEGRARLNLNERQCQQCCMEVLEVAPKYNSELSQMARDSVIALEEATSHVRDNSWEDGTFYLVNYLDSW